MKYIIYIPDSEPPGTTFSHYGVKGRSGRYKYGSGLYGYQDLRREGLMSWSLKGEKIDSDNIAIVYRKAYLKLMPSVGKIFTKEELNSNSQEVLARAYLERYKKSPNYRKNQLQTMKRISEFRKTMTQEQRKKLVDDRKEVQRLDKVYLEQQGKTIDKETGLHLKDPKQSPVWFRNVKGEVRPEDIDAYLYEMLIDVSKINYKRIPGFKDARHDNCGICAVAYDMRRRGYDVTAKGGYNFRSEFLYKDSIQYKSKDNLFLAKIQLTKDNKDTAWDAAQKEREQMYDRIVGKLKRNYPEECRGILVGGWSYVAKDGELIHGGHGFNFEKHNGRTYIIDSQIDAVMDIESDRAKGYLSDYHILTASRTDNIEPYAKDLLKNVLE